MTKTNTSIKLVLNILLGILLYFTINLIWAYFTEVLLQPTLKNYSNSTYVSLFLGGQIFSILGIVWFAKYFEDLKWGKLFYTHSGGINWVRIRNYVFTWFMVLSIMKLIEFTLIPKSFLLTASIDTIGYAIAIVFFLPVQVLAEELFFRGFLRQRFTQLGGNSAGLFISSFLFALFHSANPEIVNFGWFIVLLNYFLFGFILAYLAEKNNGLEASFGIHLANNFFFALVVNYSGSVLPTNSIWTQSNYSPYQFFIVLSLFLAILLYRIKKEKSLI